MRIASRVAWHVRPGPRRDDPGPLVLPRPRGDPRYARGALRIADELQLLPPGRRPLRPPAGLGFKALAVARSLREEHRERLRDDPGPERDLPRSHGQRSNDPMGPGDGRSPNPLRAKMRGPSFVNLQILPWLLKDRLVADAVAILGSIDIVLGDVDR